MIIISSHFIVKLVIKFYLIIIILILEMQRLDKIKKYLNLTVHLISHVSGEVEN
jgi:hypothetical protein